MGRDGSGNVLAPNLTLKLNLLLLNFQESQRQDELNQVTFLILRNISNLRHVYHFYCTLGHNRVQSTKSEMTRLQFWRFIKDSQIHHHGISLPEMDRIVAKCLDKGSVHQPTERLSLSDFLSCLTILGYVIYKDKITPAVKNNGKAKSSQSSTPLSSQSSVKSTKSGSSKTRSIVLMNCLQRLLSEHIMKHSGRVKGGFLSDPRRAINALAYMEGSWKVYRSLCETPSREPTIHMRRLLLALKDLQIIGPHLSTEIVLKILASDNPGVFDGDVYNLEIEITFLEFFEALVGCAINFVTKEMIQQSFKYVVPLTTRSSNARSGLGHSRPGSAYSRHTSAHSSRTASSQQSIPSILENTDTESVMEYQSTIKSEEENDVKDMETVVTSIDQLQIDDSGSKDVREKRSQSAASSSTLSFLDEEDEEEASLQSPRSKGSSPEVITAEMEKKEEQFNIWSTQLRIFFTRYLFTSWQKFEMLKREAAKHKARKKIPGSNIR